MKRIKVMGLLLVAVFALSAVMVSSASAGLPEYKTCHKAVPKNTGNFSDKLCSTPVGGTGGYEIGAWNEGKKTTFTGKGSKPVNRTINPFTEKVEGEVECKKEAVAGKVIGPKETENKSTWTTCKASGLPCQSALAAPGEIKGDNLEGVLVYLDAAKTKVGVKIQPKAPSSELAKYECGGIVNITATGAVIGEHSGDTTFTKGNTNTFGPGAGLHQKYYYQEEQGTDATFLGYLAWAPGYKACVTEGVTEDGETLAESEANCFGVEVGPYPGFPGPPPSFILSTATGAINGEGPATQTGVTVDKGELMKVAQ